MSDEFEDPGEPGELAGRMKATDLVNKNLIILPKELRHDGKGTNDETGEPEAYTYVDADVWVFDRSGIVEHGIGVQFSWKRVIPQLAEKIGTYVGATPVVGENNARVLQRFNDKDRASAEKAMKEIRSKPKESLADTAERVRKEFDAETEGTEPF